MAAPLHQTLALHEYPTPTVDPITKGYGEYYVYNQDSKPVSEETFNKVYSIFESYYKQLEEDSSPQEFYLNRYEFLKTTIQEIDPELELGFVPRALYELIFIGKCLKEDLKNQTICPLANLNNTKKPSKKNPKCWHRVKIGYEELDNEGQSTIVSLAFRMNKAIFKKLKGEPHTLSDFTNLATNEMDLLASYFQSKEKLKSKETTLTGSLGNEESLGFDSLADKNIVVRAIALECSEIAKDNLLLYRGTSWEKDSIVHITQRNQPVYLSYGTGLFAGCLFDLTATPFHHMKKRHAYVVYGSILDLREVFHLPIESILKQILSHGEKFHPRTRRWCTIKSTIPLFDSLLSSQLTKEDLTSKFETIMKTAQFLNRERRSRYQVYPLSSE